MHYRNVATRTSEVDRPLDSHQVANNAGGYVYEVANSTRLERFLILGTERPTYYASAQRLTKENASALRALIEKDGVNVVLTIVDISTQGRAPKQDAGIFALAMCAGIGDGETRAAALAALPKVCRTGSTLLQFASYIEQFRGWGRGLRRAVARWYEEMPIEKLAYQVVKYQNRHGWTQRDLLRVAHPNAGDVGRKLLFDWICGRLDFTTEASQAHVASVLDQDIRSVVLALAEAHDEAKQIGDLTSENRSRAIALCGVLSHEMIPTSWKNDPAVWEALLEKMPMTAMVRNLASMTTCGLLTPGSQASTVVAERLGDMERIRKARVHPISLLTALGIYRRGHGDKGSLSWIPVPQVTDALDAAFYLAFGNVEPAGKRTRIGLDVSGSMDTTAESGLTAREITTALAMIQVATEPECEVFAFSNTLTHVPMQKGQRLSDVMAFTSRLPFQSTHVGLPIKDALERNVDVDTFIVMTDNEVNTGLHPTQLLRQYRERSGRFAKLAVAGVTATKFTVADPTDPGMLDVIGFDASVPRLIADFSRGTGTRSDDGGEE